jgi:hypothetical protein
VSCGAQPACVDTQTDDANCGACGVTCALGQSCTAGKCGGGGIGDDGCMGLAQNVALEQIAVYQSVKIPIMEGNAELAASERNADVVAGRDTLFRVFVSVGAGWAPRELSARVFVENGQAVDTYSAQQTISGDSSDASSASTFQVLVPKDKITAETRYAVELVECATGSGDVMTPRFPATDGVTLEARVVGGLKITIIPVQTNARVPDTSSAGLAAYRDLMLAMYPITDLELTVGETISTAYPINWEGLLDTVRSLRASDNVAQDVYYYGLMTPTDSFQQYCGQGGCYLGLGYIPPSGPQGASLRAAIGVGWTDEMSAETLAHEVGHNHGREHAPCGGPAGVDPGYPYSQAETGVWGYDTRGQSLLPPDRTDIMGYCSEKWISDYTYQGLVERVAEINGFADVEVPPELLRPFRVLLVTASGPRWGNPITRPALPAGEPESAAVLDSAGSVLRQVEVYRSRLSHGGAFSIEVPEPEPGWHSVRVQGASAIPFP